MQLIIIAVEDFFLTTKTKLRFCFAFSFLKFKIDKRCHPSVSIHLISFMLISVFFKSSKKLRPLASEKKPFQPALLNWRIRNHSLVNFERVCLFIAGGFVLFLKAEKEKLSGVPERNGQKGGPKRLKNLPETPKKSCLKGTNKRDFQAIFYGQPCTLYMGQPKLKKIHCF